MTLKLYIEQESLVPMHIVSIGIHVLALIVNIATTHRQKRVCIVMLKIM